MAERLNITILENDKKVLNWFLSVLDQRLFNQTICESSEDFPKQLLTDKPDVVVLGLPLAGFSNKKAIETFVRSASGVPLVILVDSIPDNEVMKCIQGGANEFIRMQTPGSNLVTSVIYQAVANQEAINRNREEKSILQNLIGNLPGFIYRSRKDEDWTIEYLSEGFKDLTGYPPDDFIRNKKMVFQDLIYTPDLARVRKEARRVREKGGNFELEYRIITADNIMKWVWERGNFSGDKLANDLFNGFITDITEKKYHENLLEMIIGIGEITNQSIYSSDFLQKISQIIKDICINNWVFLLPVSGTNLFRITSASGSWEEYVGRDIRIDLPPYNDAFSKNNFMVFDYETGNGSELLENNFVLPGKRYLGLIPIMSQNEKIAMLIAGRRYMFTEQEIVIIKTIAEMINTAIERVNLYQKIKKQLMHLESLHAIDQAITSIYDIQVINNIILDQACRELDGDAADILMLNSPLNALEFYGRRGFKDSTLIGGRISLTTSVAGKVLLEKEDLFIPNLDENQLPFIQKHLSIENFKSYFAKPLSLKGKAIGVMEIFMRRPFYPDEEWISFFESLATQAAVAYDSYQKYFDLQKMQMNMASSFRSTLETWSKSLELHDIETEGHIRRVTDETLDLARKLGIAEKELPNIERGALLHDIGKLAIMDDILQKKGPLTDEEWKEIKRHPQVSRDLLSNVKMLEDALDIPYSHHENWDGSGYPQGLKGEEIPLSARIFAVVETYDALISPRPYREAWSKKQAVRYLIDQKDKKFDPNIVDLFLDFLQNAEIR